MKKYVYISISTSMCAWLWTCMVGIAHSSETQLLLDEIVAGSDANYALIKHGIAKYSVSITAFQPQKKTRTETVTVHFDGDRTRSDTGQQRIIVDKDHAIEYTAPYSDPGVIVRTRNFAQPFKVHPKRLGLDKPGGVADLINASRRNSKCDIHAIREEGGLIKVVFHWKSAFARNEYWVDPNQGYCVVRLLKWGLKTPDLPYIEIDSEFKETDNGAFVLSHSHELNRIAREQDKRLVLNNAAETEVSLLNMNLGDKPDPELFTIEGLDLPQGCRIQNRVHGKEYLFGVSAVNENDIGKPAIRGPFNSSYILILVLNATLILAIVAVYVWRRRKACA